MPNPSAQKLIKRLRYNDALKAYDGSVQIENEKIGICIWAKRNSRDYDDLRQTAEQLFRSWSSLHEDLLKSVKKELIGAGRIKTRTTLTTNDTQPFSFSIRKDEYADNQIRYDVSFNVPMVLQDDEYVEVSRNIDGSGTTSEVRSTE